MCNQVTIECGSAKLPDLDACAPSLTLQTSCVNEDITVYILTGDKNGKLKFDATTDGAGEAIIDLSTVPAGMLNEFSEVPYFIVAYTQGGEPCEIVYINICGKYYVTVYFFVKNINNLNIVS
jgi:hypothetical protein